MSDNEVIELPRDEVVNFVKAGWLAIILALALLLAQVIALFTAFTPYLAVITLGPLAWGIPRWAYQRRAKKEAPSREGWRVRDYALRSVSPIIIEMLLVLGMWLHQVPLYVGVLASASVALRVYSLFLYRRGNNLAMINDPKTVRIAQDN